MKNNKKVLIICISTHHSNTTKIAKAIGNELNAKIVKLTDVDVEIISDYDLIGFSSGIYFNKYHKSLLHIIDKFSVLTEKKHLCFLRAE